MIVLFFLFFFVARDYINKLHTVNVSILAYLGSGSTVEQKFNKNSHRFMFLLKLVRCSHKKMELHFCFSTAADLKEKILNFALIPNCAR